MQGRQLPDITFKTRVRDEAIGGSNPFRWQDVTTADIFAGKRVVGVVVVGGCGHGVNFFEREKKKGGESSQGFRGGRRDPRGVKPCCSNA